MADSKISDLAAVTTLLSTDEYVVARAGVSNKITGANLGAGARGPGGLELVYRYTVVGSDKASIDTGADTADAGSGDWTGGDLLEVLVTSRTDDAGAVAVLNVSVNNDGAGTSYDLQYVRGNNASASAGVSNAAAVWGLFTHGSGGRASVPGTVAIRIPDYAGTVFEKSGDASVTSPDSTAANEDFRAYALTWRNTAAINRLKVAAAGTAKLKVGSQLLIYKRRAS